MLYLISYGLARLAQAYPELTATLNNLGATEVLPSQWLLSNPSRATELCDYIKRAGRLDADDRLLVVEVTNHAAWTHLLIDHATAHTIFGTATR